MTTTIEHDYQGHDYQNGSYIPRVHIGNKEEIILGLLKEASDIAHSGFMRYFAQGREIHRITAQLEQLGVILLTGVNEDDGWFLAYTQHQPDCQLDTTGLCRCEAQYKIKGGW